MTTTNTLTAHELRTFIIDIFDGGYRASDAEDIKINFPGLSDEDLRRTIEGLEDLAEQNGEAA